MDWIIVYTQTIGFFRARISPERMETSLLKRQAVINVRENIDMHAKKIY